MEAMPRLTRGKPEGNLVSAPVLCSIAGHAVIIILFQVLQQWMLLQQPWCVCCCGIAVFGGLAALLRFSAQKNTLLDH